MASERPLYTMPLVSTAMQLSCGTPMAFRRSSVAMPAAPGPFRTTLTSFNSRPVRWQTLIRPAAEMIAVPCWSSWNTGMSMSSCNADSTMKHSGDLMSSRLMPPKVGPMLRTTVMISSGSVAVISMSMASTSAKRLKSTPLPSITGLAASGPRSPRPRIAVPFDTTATMLPLDVYS